MRSSRKQPTASQDSPTIRPGSSSRAGGSSRIIPCSGALWWLCARVLTASDPADAAWEAWQLVNEDGTTDRLSRLLPFPHDEPIAVLGWPDLAGAALAERPDLDVVAIRRRSGDDHRQPGSPGATPPSAS